MFSNDMKYLITIEHETNWEGRQEHANFGDDEQLLFIWRQGDDGKYTPAYSLNADYLVRMFIIFKSVEEINEGEKEPEIDLQESE